MFIPLFFLAIPVFSIPISQEYVIHPDEPLPLIGHSAPEALDAPELNSLEIQSISHSYAVDLSGPTTEEQLNCLRERGYRSVFVQGFDKGILDPDVINTIKNSYEAGLGTEVFLTPKYNSVLTGSQQVDILLKNLASNQITIRSIWLKITSPSDWQGSVAGQISFIQSMVKRARELGLVVGIYSSVYDWEQLTSGWNTVGNDVLLWYWHVLGDGIGGETEADFSDFRKFGGWNAASVKQFAQNEKVCNLVVNRNVYPTAISRNSRIQQDLKDAVKISIGSIGI